MSYEANEERYLAAAHAVQTGVMCDLEFNPESGKPKHLRAGVNLAMAKHAADIKLG